MFGIGGTELLVILAIVLLIFGGAKLPQLARSMGRSIGEFSKGKKELEGEIKDMEKTASETIKEAEKEIKEEPKLEEKSAAESETEIAKGTGKKAQKE